MAMAQTKHRLCLQVSYRATYWPRPKIGIPLGVTTRAMPMGTSPTRTNVAALKRKPRPLDPTTLVRRERGSPRRNRSLVDKPEPGHPCRQRRTNRQICQQDEANARHSKVQSRAITQNQPPRPVPNARVLPGRPPEDRPKSCPLPSQRPRPPSDPIGEENVVNLLNHLCN